MNSSSSGGKLERFFTGKGFYIVLFLCAAVIGVSAWMMATGNETMEDVSAAAEPKYDNSRVETVILSPATEEPQTAAMSETFAEAEAEAETDTASAETDEAAAVWSEAESAETVPESFIWPVAGEISRSHDLSALHYDETMRDWRTHAGVDISAPLGTPVTAAHGGTVESVSEDDLYGVTVVINRGDGVCSVYSNLAPETAVSAGDSVERGTVIGSVGESAICESSQDAHLHFAVTANGESADPLSYLPA